MLAKREARVDIGPSRVDIGPSTHRKRGWLAPVGPPPQSPPFPPSLAGPRSPARSPAGLRSPARSPAGLRSPARSPAARSPAKRGDIHRGEFYVHVGGCQSLQGGGGLDPYVRVFVDGQPRGKTRVKWNTCNPVWAEAFPVGALAPESTITFEVLDRDTFSADDILARASVGCKSVGTAGGGEVQLLDLVRPGGAVMGGGAFLGVAVCSAGDLRQCDAYWQLRRPVMAAAAAGGAGRPRRWYVVTPAALSRCGWDAVTVLALSYAAFLTPFEIGVVRSTIPNAWLAIDWIVTAIFVLDTAKEGLLAFFDEATRQWVFDERHILDRYLHGWCAIDCCAAVPWRLAVRLGKSAFRGGTVRRLLPALRLLELLRAARVGRVVARLRGGQRGEEGGGGGPLRGFFARLPNSTMRLCKFAFLCLLALHWVACAWALLPTLQPKGFGWTHNLDSLAGRGSRPFALYVSSFEFALMCMVMDQGTVVPTNTWEQVCYLFMALFMGSMYAYVIGMICGVVTTMDPATTEFRATADLLNQYITELGVDCDTAEKARRYFAHTEPHFRASYYRKLLKTLSPELRGHFAQHICGVWIHNVYFFNCHDLNERALFVTSVALALDVQSFNPAECVSRAGDRADAMYIVRRGIVGVRGAALSCGRFFGEEMIRDGAYREYTAVCMTFVDVQVLSRDALRAILNEARFPRTRQLIRLRILYMAFQRHVRLIAKALRLRPGYVRMSSDELQKWKEVLRFKGNEGSSPTPEPEAHSDSDSDGDAPGGVLASFRRAARKTQPLSDRKKTKLRDLLDLHKEGVAALRAELEQQHGCDVAAELSRSPATNRIGAVCEPLTPTRIARAAPDDGITRADLENLEARLLGQITARFGSLFQQQQQQQQQQNPQRLAQPSPSARQCASETPRTPLGALTQNWKAPVDASHRDAKTHPAPSSPRQ
ncbi:hypothetical protein M885DRAFT_481006 [Pelagophyceae sp. CCMP2097]|nr:hypothetical protein M885DRAFT_481006 [Pelagophyceae sp. CCMP2097]